MSGPDFLHKIKLALREAKESRACLEKIRMARLDRFETLLDSEREAGELAAIFAAIVMKVGQRLERENGPKRTEN